MKTVFAIIGCFIGLILIGWILQASDYVNFAFWAPKYENVRRNVFENTNSYVRGKIQDLSNYKLQFDQAKSAADNVAIQSVVRQQFADFDINKCPDGLKLFLSEARGF